MPGRSQERYDWMIVDEFFSIEAVSNIDDQVERFMHLRQIFIKDMPTKKAREHLIEATKCYVQGFYQASVIICRSVIEFVLENELREILQARDDIVEDRFDRMIRECPIMDIEDQIPVEEFFRRVAEALAPRVQMNAVEIARLLQEREAQTSTVLKPGLAIPHIVVKGNNQFHILLARSRKGIQFATEKGSHVHVAFVLAGSEDLRNYHLRVLMFIAHITQESDFEDRWMRAQGPAALRNLILLSKRTRLPEESA